MLLKNNFTLNDSIMKQAISKSVAEELKFNPT